MTSMQTRIYLPLSVAALRRLSRDGVLDAPPFPAYAVTPDLRREHPAADDEELEYLAFVDAATSTGAPRVVAAADVEADDVEPSDAVDAASGAPSAVRVSASVPRRQVVSFHVADAHADADGAGSGGAGIPELSWYDATELEVVVGLLG
jgi:hypothetical protein